MLYISELCEDCAIANEFDYEIDYAWASIHDNEHVIMACDVWLQQRITAVMMVLRQELVSPYVPTAISTSYCNHQFDKNNS